MPPSHRRFQKKKHPHRPRSHTPGSHIPEGGKQQPRQASGPLPKIFVEGTLQLKGKFGFVLSEDPKLGDVLIQGPTLRLAMPDDRVRARVIPVPGETRRSGEIVEVLEHTHQTMVGTFKRFGNMAAVVAENDLAMIRILDMQKFSPKVGDVAVIRITSWPTDKESAAGTLVEVLGSRDTPGVDLEMVIRKYGLPQKFPDDAASEAASLGTEVPEAMWKDPSRTLFFDQRVFTIDGADAKDFDDAVSLEPIADGWRLGVHIADVSQYVKEEHPLNEEAERRGTSVYLTGSVIPMLPFPISDNLCSLRPNTIRLTLSCLMDINRDGQVVNQRVVESAIKSSKRFTYEEVEEILKGNNPTDLDPKITADVREMGEVARLLRKKRFGRGSLDFDFPEPHVITGLNGRPLDIRKRERLEAHRLIEDFMVLANETVARYMSALPFLYRVHETPDEARTLKLKKSLEALGLRVPQGDIKEPSTLSEVLTATEGTPLQATVHILILRSLKQAIYSPINKGHFGLASKCYTHFTSPIRRYPDLIVHRIVKERIHGIHRPEYWAKALTGLCDHASKRERVAVEAEREFMDIQKVRLMESHVGETFSGVVTSVTNFGFFVQLNEFFVDGLVHVTNLGSDYFVFDEGRMTLTGRRTGQVFLMGTKVKIKLAAANPVKRQLDFQLISAETSSKRAGGHGKEFKKEYGRSRPHKKR